MKEKVNNIEKMDNCRFCAKMADWQRDDDHKMVSFDCTYWEKKTGQTDYSIWVYPDMEFVCAHFVEAGTEKSSVQKLEKKMFELEKENDALRTELGKYE